MAEDRDARRAHRGEHAGGLILRAPQLRVRRRHDELEATPLVGLQVEAAVDQDVGLDALEHAEPAPPGGVQPVDLVMLPRDGLHAHAPGDRQAVRVVGDPQAGVTERPARLDHRVQALAAVAPGRVHLEVAAECRTRHDARFERRVEHPPHDLFAEKPGAQRPARRRLGPLP